MARTWRLVASTALFTLIAPVGVTVFGPRLLLGRHPAIMADAGIAPAVFLLAVGALVYLWCAADFIFAGRGTPAPYDAPRLLVERGLYRYTRNPMYAGVTAALVGEAILFHWPALAIYAAVVVSGFHLRVVLVEERVLRESFGAQFEAYCRRVPRWFIR